MLIECPRCAARYDVAAGLIGPAGKSVRCVRCGNVWLAKPISEAPPEPPAQWPEPPARPALREIPVEPAGPPAEPAEDPALAEFRAAQEDGRRRRPASDTAKGDAVRDGFARFPAVPEDQPPSRPPLAWAVTVGWLATAAVLGTAAWGAYTYRDAVMQAWPPSQHVYLALGLAAAPGRDAAH